MCDKIKFKFYDKTGRVREFSETIWEFLTATMKWNHLLSHLTHIFRYCYRYHRKKQLHHEHSYHHKEYFCLCIIHIDSWNLKFLPIPSGWWFKFFFWSEHITFILQYVYWFSLECGHMWNRFILKHCYF